MIYLFQDMNRQFWKYLVLVLGISSCVERIDFEVPESNLPLIVEGMISDQPGPYQVSISIGSNLNEDSIYYEPVTDAKISLFDDSNQVEQFTELFPGTYETSGSIRGEIGNTYFIRIELKDGRIFESYPELLNPVGSIKNIRFEYEARIAERFGEVVAADVFNVFVDAQSPISSSESYIRWRFNGTYKAETNPEQHIKWLPGRGPNLQKYLDPLPCSGYIVDYFPSPRIAKKSDCTCCECWAQDFEKAPNVLNTYLVQDGQFNNVLVAEVPINNATFNEKYLVEIEQMSLTKSAFDFFKLIQSQKQGASDIFQPTYGVITGNINGVNTQSKVTGIFWATSISTKSKFILRSDIPYPITPITTITQECIDYYPNAFDIEPEGWN